MTGDKLLSIRLENVSKSFSARGGRVHVLRDINLEFPAKRRIGLLGGNGAGKSTLLRILGGQMRPDTGRVISAAQISWQIGFAGSFHPELTGQQNTRFIARIYNVDTDALCNYVQTFSGIGRHFHMPVRTYSTGMRARMSFGVSMGIPFSWYLVDEVTAVGDAEFRRKCAATLRQRLGVSGAIIVSHSVVTIKELCDCAMILNNGRIVWFDDVDKALKRYSDQG